MVDWVSAILNVFSEYLALLESFDFLGVPFLWILVALGLVPVILSLVFRGI